MSILKERLVFSPKDIIQSIKPIDSLDLEREMVVSIDPGLHNPLACLWISKDNQGFIYVLDEHYEAEKDIEYHSKKIKEKCELLGCWRQKNNKYFGYIDPAARQKGLLGVLSVRELFYKHGIELDPAKKDPLLFISELKSLFHKQKIFIHPRCENLIAELFNYRWGELEYPQKKDDHAIDALQFYILSNL